MSDPQSDADRIRQRRLARLGGTPSNTSTTTGSNDNTSSINSNATSTGSVGGVGGGSDSRPASALDRLNANASQPRTIAQGGPSSSSSASTSKPSTPVQARPGSSLNVPPTSLNSAASSSLSPSYYNTSTLKPSSSSSTPISTPTAKLNLSANGKPGTTPGGARKLPYEEYESNSILHILNVSPEMVISEFPDNKYGRVGKDESDTLLIAKLSVETKEGEDGGVTIFEYLTGCWKRVHRVNREGLRMGYSEDELIRWKETMDKLKDLIISYCGYTLEDPGMFPQPPGRPVGPAEFLPLLLASNSQASDPYSTSTSNPSSTLAPLPPTLPLTPADLPMFLSDLSNRFKEEGLDGILESVCSEFFQGFFKRQVDGKPVDLLSQEWRAWVGGVAVLTSVKGIAAKLPSLKVWFEEFAQPEQIEWFSLLGPITRLSVFPREFPTIYKTYFLNAESRSKDDIKANQLTLGQTLVNLQDDLFQSYNAIVRASPESREKLLSFFAEVVKRNVKRSGMRVDHRTVASDGYMMNMQGMLLRLFEPVMDVTYSKIDRIDSDYYRHSKRVDIKEETKMRAAQDEANEYYSEDKMQTEPTPGSSPFISDIFFLLQTYQHLGLNKTLDNRDRAEKNVKEFKKDLKRLEAEKAGWQAGTPQAMQGEAMLTKLKNDIDVLKASVCAYDAALLNKEIIQKNIAFLSFSMTWLVRLVDPRHAHPAQTIELPLPDEAPLRFRMLPEYLLENISDYLEFVVKHAPPETLDKSDKDVIITFMIVFLSPNYVNNPFLKAKFMSMLAIGVQPWGYFRKGIFYDNLVEHPLAVQHLMPTLIRFFVDVEMTGGHTQFWDKFNFRRDIDSIIQALWSNPEHRNAFVKTRHTDFELVIKFSNMLMSDTTFHLDESLTGLAKINSIRSEMEDRTTWEAKPEAERKELESQLSSAEANTPFHTMMGRSHVKLMKEFTATTKEPFLTGEIVGRLAATLDENMVVMVGPKMQELKVTDPEKFAFKPKELLAEITQIYINLGDSPEFIRAVADDGRSYSKATFERLVRVLKNRAIMLDNEIKQVLAFLGKVEEAKATIEIEDEREIPDEFLDPLMATLMKNPVILPVSRVTVDQSTIRAVLLSNNKDPFNNVPLKYEDCVPDEDLKKRIDAWIAEGSVRPSNLDEPVSMDVDEVANRPE